MCDAHDRMYHVLSHEIRKRSGTSVGSTALLHDMERGPDGLAVLATEFTRRWGSADGAAHVFERVELARLRPTQPRP